MVIASCVAIGAVTVVATLVIGHKTPGTATPEYGKRLLMGACSSCHIDAGAEPGELSLIHAISRYPNNIEDRINECMTRNVNSRPLPRDGTEMLAMISWLRFLADEDAATSAIRRQSHDPPAFKTPGRAPDPRAGEQLFAKRCVDCHGKDGAGLPASRNPAEGYLFPPLWGPDSFTDGAEMHNAATAARFIKAKMPLGRPDLDDDQAFDVAAFIDARPRPHFRGGVVVR
jgi:thiosulfate dehydrogenase